MTALETDLGEEAWIETHRLIAHLVIPAVISLALMALYFSGVESLQSVVAPSIDGMHPFSQREFGALELMQNMVLLSIIFLLLDILIHTPAPCVRLACVVLCAGFIFLFLEEIDYGAHWVELLTGQQQPLSPQAWDRNFHNRLTASGVQYGAYMKGSAKIFVILAFFAGPFLLRRSRLAIVRLLRPSRWMAATVVLMLLLSMLAHQLDEAGLSFIDGFPGNLEYNISEFRELNLYYLFLLYFVDLRHRFRVAGS